VRVEDRLRTEEIAALIRQRAVPIASTTARTPAPPRCSSPRRDGAHPEPSSGQFAANRPSPQHSLGEAAAGHQWCRFAARLRLGDDSPNLRPTTRLSSQGLAAVSQL